MGTDGVPPSPLTPLSPQVLGTPTREQIREMNPNYTEFKFPQIKAHPWSKVGQGIWALLHWGIW